MKVIAGPMHVCTTGRSDMMFVRMQHAVKRWCRHFSDQPLELAKLSWRQQAAGLSPV